MKSADYQRLYDAVTRVAKQAYAPYSQFAVGAALLMKDGQIITGANVENASYGLSNCAERSALFTAYSLGYRQNDIIGMMIIGPTLGPVSPCGACRQVMAELINPDVEVVMTNWEKQDLVVKVKDLLPFRFAKDDLDGRKQV
ncbi:MAG TPA: cytidine deaminase [Bacilli bacterium]|nr:MAG: Cytidine deaminase [Tenericutes bacterium ADurb.BinA124]HPX84672.1 cytidine deaminase [Bacilli bacterium]HQC74522.1 cytidine deaminase [Bacilli bacterium]